MSFHTHFLHLEILYDKMYVNIHSFRKSGAKMRILICDDDTLFIEQLQKYIESYFESNHLKCPELVSFTSGESLLADKNEKDIVFLDIEMPGMNGIYVGNELKKANKNVIIFVVTSYSEYLDEAMRFHVFRYLSKPLDKQRFFRNMKDALAYYNSITTKIPVETKQGVYSFPASQIIAIEAQGRKVIWLIGWNNSPKTVFSRHTGALLLISNILWTLIIPPYIYRISRLQLI